VITNPAFEDLDHRPALGFERSPLPSVTALVGAELRLPELAIRLGKREAAAGTPMPEASVHEDRYAKGDEGDVGTSDGTTPVQSVPDVSGSPESTA